MQNKIRLLIDETCVGSEWLMTLKFIAAEKGYPLVCPPPHAKTTSQKYGPEIALFNFFSPMPTAKHLLTCNIYNKPADKYIYPVSSNSLDTVFKSPQFAKFLPIFTSDFRQAIDWYVQGNPIIVKTPNQKAKFFLGPENDKPSAGSIYSLLFPYKKSIQLHFFAGEAIEVENFVTKSGDIYPVDFTKLHWDFRFQTLNNSSYQRGALENYSAVINTIKEELQNHEQNIVNQSFTLQALVDSNNNFVVIDYIPWSKEINSLMIENNRAYANAIVNTMAKKSGFEI